MTLSEIENLFINDNDNSNGELIRYEKILKKCSPGDIITFLDAHRNDLMEYINNHKKLMNMLFIRLRNALLDYDKFCDILANHIKPGMDFYQYASENAIFFEPGKSPSFFFADNSYEEWSEDVYNREDLEKTYNNMIDNIKNNLEMLNPTYSISEIYRLLKDFYYNFYCSTMFYMDNGSYGRFICALNLHEDDYEKTMDHDEAINSLFRIARSVDLALSFYKLDDEEEVLRTRKEQRKVLANLSKIIGNNKTYLSKVILGLLDGIPDADKKIKYLIREYNKVSTEPYDLIAYTEDGRVLEGETYGMIIDYYAYKLIDGSLSRDDASVIIMDLMNAGYDEREIDTYISIINSKFFEMDNEYLLLFFQSLIANREIISKNLTIDIIEYSPVMCDEGRYNPDDSSLELCLYEKIAGELDIKENAIENIYHEMRHAYQFQTMEKNYSLKGLLTLIDNLLINRPAPDKDTDSEYEGRYESIYFEVDARVYSFYKTFYTLKDYDKEYADNYLKTKSQDDKVLNYATKLYRENNDGRFMRDVKKLDDINYFIFLFNTLYERYSLDDIKMIRLQYKALEAITNEDGILYSYEELENIFNNIKCTNEEDIKYRAFLYSFMQKYTEAIGKSDLFVMNNMSR